MGFAISTIVHAVLAVLLIIELGLTGYVVDATNYWNGSPSSFAFMLFCSIWSILALIYIALVSIYLRRFFLEVVAVALLVITTIFWFAGSIAMAAFIGVPHCHGNNFCGSAQAAVAFGFFIWALFLGLTVLDGLSFMRSRGHNANADSSKAGHSFA